MVRSSIDGHCTVTKNSRPFQPTEGVAIPLMLFSVSDSRVVVGTTTPPSRRTMEYDAVRKPGAWSSSTATRMFPSVDAVALAWDHCDVCNRRVSVTVPSFAATVINQTFRTQGPVPLHDVLSVT